MRHLSHMEEHWLACRDSVCGTWPQLCYLSTGRDKGMPAGLMTSVSFHIQVYISCSVMMCEAGNPDTRCSQGCVNTTWSNNRRGKREIVTQTLMHRISQGPLRLKRSAERTESPGMKTQSVSWQHSCLEWDWINIMLLLSPVMNLNLNLVFIAGCLLAAVGMVSAVVMYKAKVSRVKYQPLPAFEN